MTRQIVLDTETTGIDFKSGHRVIEIGCVEIVNRKFTGSEYQTYLNPDRESEEGALKVHGLTFEFLQDKPRFSEVVDDFLDFINGSELLIHNADFDLSFLNFECKLANKELIERANIIDTLEIARQKYPGAQNSLDALCKRFNIDNSKREKHTACLLYTSDAADE